MSCHTSSRHPFHPSIQRPLHAALATLTIALLACVPPRARAQQPAVPAPAPPISSPIPQPAPQPPPQPLPVPQPMPQPTPPLPPSAPAQPIVAYRPPAIALVQPTPGAALPPDRAVLIFRFGAGEPSDPVDASSFAVWVNGANRSTSFQVAGVEAWGPLSDAHAGTSSTPLAPGAYQVTARICSSKGACGSTAATVNVAASEGALSKADEGLSRRQRLIDLLLAGVRRLVGP